MLVEVSRFFPFSLVVISSVSVICRFFCLFDEVEFQKITPARQIVAYYYLIYGLLETKYPNYFY